MSSAVQRCFFDLSSRAKLRIGGSDALRFLNGQLSNDVSKSSESAAIQACILNAKGKMNAHVFVARAENFFFMDTDSQLRETLPTRLDRYIIADDVQLEDVAQTFSTFHCLGESPVNTLADCRSVSAARFGEPGVDLWIETTKSGDLRQRLAAEMSFCNETEAETLRIERGIPRWGAELTEEIIPIEANLEAQTIDYEKGCYIGQEVISRMKMSGQTNKRLCGIVPMSDASLEASMRLFPAGDEKKQCGWISSACRSPRLGKEIALGYVKRGFNDIGSQLDAVRGDNPSSSPAVRVKVVDIPFR